MTHPEFITYLEQFHRRLVQLSESKGAEYANDTDQLANFKRLGARLHVEPELVCLVLLTKHLDALDHFTWKLSSGEPFVTSEPVQERVEDAVNYLLLFSALLVDRGGVASKVVNGLRRRLVGADRGEDHQGERP